MFFPKFKIPCNKFDLFDRPKLFQMILSDKFLKQSDTETFLKFNNCFSTEFEC